MSKRKHLWKSMLAAGAIVLSLQFAGQAEAAFGDTVLKYGMSGEDVKTLQVTLKELGYFSVNPTGYFGPITKDAVIRYQQAKGLAVDGIVGRQTFSALNKSLANTGQYGSKSQLQQAIAATAKQYIGVPYQWGGETSSGFDCSGYSQFVFAKSGLTLPRVTVDQYNAGTPIAKSQLEVGDLVFFTTYKPGPSHLGIYLGNDQFIHASTSKGVMISSLSNSYWAARYIGARSYF